MKNLSVISRYFYGLKTVKVKYFTCEVWIKKRGETLPDFLLLQLPYNPHFASSADISSGDSAKCEMEHQHQPPFDLRRTPHDAAAAPPPPPPAAAAHTTADPFLFDLSLSALWPHKIKKQMDADTGIGKEF